MLFQRCQATCFKCTGYPDVSLISCCQRDYHHGITSSAERLSPMITSSACFVLTTDVQSYNGLGRIYHPRLSVVTPLHQGYARLIDIASLRKTTMRYVQRRLV
jgi:hypothetical protein